MKKSRNSHLSLELNKNDLALGLRPLTARSLVASMLLGTHPPRLPVSALVAAAELFGLSEGACRTTLSRMVIAGDLTTNDGWYELAGALIGRQRRQDIGRQGTRQPWDGSWLVMIVTADRRMPSERVDARTTLTEHRYAELREGVWVRPANLVEDDDVMHLTSQGWQAGVMVFDPQLKVDQLWPLREWQVQAEGLQQALTDLIPPLEVDDRTVLARGFIVAAAALRHLRQDPLLPDELLPEGWPGRLFRDDYDRFDEAYRRVLRDFFRENRFPV